MCVRVRVCVCVPSCHAPREKAIPSHRPPSIVVSVYLRTSKMSQANCKFEIVFIEC